MSRPTSRRDTRIGLETTRSNRRTLRRSPAAPPGGGRTTRVPDWDGACGASHGALITSDVPAAFAAPWFAYTAWKYWGAPTPRRLLTLTLTVEVRLPLALVAMPVARYTGVLACSRFQAQPIPKADTNQMVDAGVPGGLPRRDPAVAFAVAAAIRAGIAILGPQLEKRRLHGIHARS